MIEFIEHPHTGYALRTRENVMKTDFTIAFAVDFQSYGEILTSKCCSAAGKTIFQIAIPETLRVTTADVKPLRDHILKSGHHVINIAGNGIYSMGIINQKSLDDYIHNFMSAVLSDSDFPDTFTIRTGGQTGVDEAGAKFGDAYGCKTIVCCDKEWTFRNSFHRDIKGAAEFKGRFGEQYDVRDLL